jgi:16S rRNA processing protein RimM
MPDGPWLRAGRVGRPHGLDGSFHVLEAKPQLLEVGAPLLIDSQECRIIRRAGDDRRPIIAVEGCADRSAAQTLGGRELLAPREDAPVLEPDEWWAEDLEGCSVRDGERLIGTVVRLTALPSVDVLEVQRSEGGEDLLVPLVGDAVRNVDVQRKEIDIDLRFLGET